MTPVRCYCCCLLLFICILSVRCQDGGVSQKCRDLFTCMIEKDCVQVCRFLCLSSFNTYFGLHSYCLFFAIEMETKKKQQDEQQREKV